MAQLHYGHIKVDETTIRYYRTSEEKPPVVFIHGFSDNAFRWSRLAFSLERYFEIILVDVRCHGLSDASNVGFTPEERARDIAELITQLNLDMPVLVGHSMGAETSMYTAAFYPKLVSAMLLEDPPFFPLEKENDSEWKNGMYTEWIESFHAERTTSFQDFMKITRENHPHWHEKDIFHWAKARSQVKPEAVNFITTEKEPWDFYAKKVKKPTMVLIGEEENGGLMSVETANHLGEIWKKNSVIKKFEGASHRILFDEFDLYLDQVIPFLKKMTGW